jgi:uncharacterized membrane protein YuzA (DUF378 family)
MSTLVGWLVFAVILVVGASIVMWLFGAIVTAVLYIVLGLVAGVRAIGRALSPRWDDRDWINELDHRSRKA